MTAYYNEYDPKAAAWLRELIKQGHIADGVVDDRSIEDVRPDELAGFTQCHFFAGIGVWSYALRQAGWSDDRPVWTGSCPCQPFSAAGKGAGFDDERHLWPAFHHLISQCRPPIVIGEQVASKDGLGWLDLVLSDLEATGYSSGAVDLCAAGVGAPHIRQRLWWVGTRLGNASHWGQRAGISDHGRGGGDQGADRATGDAGSVADADNARLEGRIGMPERADQCAVGAGSLEGGLADTTSSGRKSCKGDAGVCNEDAGTSAAAVKRSTVCPPDAAPASGPTNGFWRDADWLFCRDGKWRPVEPGTSPLAHGSAAKVGRLRGYGNAIVAQAAQAFIESMMETMK